MDKTLFSAFSGSVTKERRERQEQTTKSYLQTLS